MIEDSRISSLHLIGSKKSGGAERFFCRLVNALDENNNPVTAGIPSGSMLADELKSSVDVHQLRMRNVFDPFSRWELSSLIRHLSPDIVQTYMGRATRLVKLSGKNRPLHVARLGGYYNLKGYRHADAWVGNTKGICDYLVGNGMPSEKVFFISNFIDVPESMADELLSGFRQQQGISQSAWLIAAVGRLHPNKGFADLIKALATLPDEIQGRPLVLAIAGDGELKTELQSLAEDAGVAKRVHWLGWMSDPDVLYQAADLFVCPSVHEPLGNVILEAWSRQVPVVSTATDGARELIENDISGLMVDVGDSQNMAEAISAVLGSQENERLQLVQNGLLTLKQRYSREVIVGQYLDMYEQLLDAN